MGAHSPHYPMPASHHIYVIMFWDCKVRNNTGLDDLNVIMVLISSGLNTCPIKYFLFRIKKNAVRLFLSPLWVLMFLTV